MFLAFLLWSLYCLFALNIAVCFFGWCCKEVAYPHIFVVAYL